MADIHYAQFAGINNKEKNYCLADDELTIATNVDIDDAKRLSRRDGTKRLYSGDCHSLFADGDVCLFRAGTGLYRLFADYSAALLKSSLTGRTVYHAMPGRIYFSDGAFSGWTDGERVLQWGISRPSAQPQAVALVDGLLPPGRYQYALTYLRDDSESGSPQAGVIEAAHGISFTGIPVSADASVIGKAIYLSRPNGDTLYRVLTLDNAATTAQYSGDCRDYRVVLESARNQPAPGATRISEYKGRLLIAADHYLFYSAPYQHEVFRSAWCYAFDSRVQLIAPVNDGVFVGVEAQIFFLAGEDIATAQLLPKADYGALGQSAAYAEGAHVLKGFPAPVALFASTAGICIGSDGGGFFNVSEARYVMPPSREAANLVRTTKNFTQYLSILK